MYTLGWGHSQSHGFKLWKEHILFVLLCRPSWLLFEAMFEDVYGINVLMAVVHLCVLYADCFSHEHIINNYHMNGSKIVTLLFSSGMGNLFQGKSGGSCAEKCKEKQDQLLV